MPLEFCFIFVPGYFRVFLFLFFCENFKFIEVQFFCRCILFSLAAFCQFLLEAFLPSNWRCIITMLTVCERTLQLRVLRLNYIMRHHVTWHDRTWLGLIWPCLPLPLLAWPSWSDLAGHSMSRPDLFFADLNWPVLADLTTSLGWPDLTWHDMT